MDKDLAIWQEWKQTKDQEKYEKLIKQLKPLMHKEINKYRAAPVPRPVLEAHGYKIMHDAITHYDPKKGVKLSTYVTNRLKKLHRHVIELQNIAYIPEARALKIGTYQRALEELQQKLGREPTTAELADELSWPIQEVERMRIELRSDLGEDVTDDILAITKPDISKTIVNMYYHDLDKTDQQILEYSLGLFGKPRLSTKKIAQQLGLPEKQVRERQIKFIEELRDLLRKHGYAV